MFFLGFKKSGSISTDLRCRTILQARRDGIPLSGHDGIGGQCSLCCPRPRWRMDTAIGRSECVSVSDFSITRPLIQSRRKRAITRPQNNSALSRSAYARWQSCKIDSSPFLLFIDSVWPIFIPWGNAREEINQSMGVCGILQRRNNPHQ